MPAKALRAWQAQFPAGAVVAFEAGIAHFAGFIGADEQNLAQSCVEVNLGRKEDGVRDFQCYKSVPLRLELRHVLSRLRNAYRSISQRRWSLLCRGYEMNQWNEQMELNSLSS